MNILPDLAKEERRELSEVVLKASLSEHSQEKEKGEQSRKEEGFI